MAMVMVLDGDDGYGHGDSVMAMARGGNIPRFKFWSACKLSASSSAGA